MKKLLLIISLFFAMMLTTPVSVDAQCPMCRMSAESNLKAGGTAGKGLNAGILYMLATPYLLVGIIGYIWYRNKRREEEENALLQIEPPQLN